MQFVLFIATIFLLASFPLSFAGTSITVSSAYAKKPVNIKIQGAGVGGCDVILNPGQTDTSACWCLWGTINYSFCAYTAGALTETATNSSTKPHGGEKDVNLGNGKCAIVTGESLLCSDLTSLGNCYNGAYSCTVDENGLCHCATV